MNPFLGVSSLVAPLKTVEIILNKHKLLLRASYPKIKLSRSLYCEWSTWFVLCLFLSSAHKI